MCAGGIKEGVSGASILMGSGAELPAHIVYLAEEPQREVLELRRCSHVTMLLCGRTQLDNAICFEPVNYQEQLSQIEI
jgi:hypothetical protein